MAFQKILVSQHFIFHSKGCGESAELEKVIVLIVMPSTLVGRVKHQIPTLQDHKMGFIVMFFRYGGCKGGTFCEGSIHNLVFLFIGLFKSVNETAS